MYELEFVRGHVEVYLDGAFCFSADTRGEAEAEIALPHRLTASPHALRQAERSYSAKGRVRGKILADLPCWNFPYQSRYNGKRPAGITRRGVPRYREIQEVEKRNQLKK